MPPMRWNRVDPHRPMPVHEHSWMQSEGLARSFWKQRVLPLTVGEHMRHNPYPDRVWALKTIFPSPCLRTCSSPCSDHVWALKLFSQCLRTCKANAQTCPKPIRRPCLSVKTIFHRPCLRDMQSQCPDHVWALKLFSPDHVWEQANTPSHGWVLNIFSPDHLYI